LIDHAGNHADQRTRKDWLLHWKVVTPQNLALDQQLCAQIVSLKWGWQKAIARWIPLIGIDAVQYPYEVGRPAPEDAIESEAQLRRLYFACVLRADGGNQVGVVNPAFQKTDPPPVLEAVNRQQTPRQVEAR
jgi:hypothetical protein